MTSPLRLIPTAGLLCLLALTALTASTAWANHLHYVPVPTDPIWAPTIADHVADPEVPLHEWIVGAGNADPAVYSRSGTLVSYVRPAGPPVTTISMFDAPAQADHTNARTTAYFEFEVSQLDAANGKSLQMGLTDLESNLNYDEAQNSIRGDKEPLNIAAAPTWGDLATLPYRVRVYYNFEDHIATFVVVDDTLGASDPISWKSAGTNPFTNHFGDIGGTDPDDLDIYLYVSCEVDCTIDVLDWGILSCDTTSSDVDIAGCSTATARDLATCRADLDQADLDLATCLAAPGPDLDGDGEADVTDLCPTTPTAEPVDSDGCSHDEFCARIAVLDRQGRKTCRRSDWQADEPTRTSPKDCAIDGQGPGREDDLCRSRDD